MIGVSKNLKLKKKLLKGVKLLNDAVSSTLGPGGRTVLIEDKMNGTKITKDGVTVAKAFTELEDKVESIGANLVKNVSIKSANEAGDGTTTSTLLAASMFEEGVKLVTQGINATSVKQGIDAASKQVVHFLKSISKEISTEEQIKQVAYISGNNDSEIGSLIARALDKVGKDGLVSVEESKTGETELEVVEGMQFDRGYKSPHFVTNNNNMSAVLDNPFILIYDGRISTANELVPILQKCNSENRSLLVIAEDIDSEPLAVLVVNKLRGVVKVAAVKAPEFGDKRTLVLEDIAVLTGGTVLSKQKGHKLEALNPAIIDQVMGKASSVIVGKDKTTIIDGKGDSEAIQKRINEIKDQYDSEVSSYEKEKLQERIGKLIGGVAIIRVGGNSELEIKEKRDRVEDALFATKAALDEGVVPGGGMALLLASKTLSSESDDYAYKLGIDIVKKACTAPFIKILTNVGIDNWQEIYSQIEAHKYESKTQFHVYNAKTGKIVGAFETGLIDPTKVVRTAIENASSVVGTMLTTESVIYQVEDKKDSDDPMMGMGM